MVRKNIRYLRKIFKETQVDIANLLNVPQNTISDYERGISPVPNDRLEILAYHYWLTPDDLKYRDLSSIEGIAEIPKKQLVFSAMNALFPFLKNDDNHRDSYFSDAYTSFFKMQHEVILGKQMDFDKIIDCLASFRISWEKYKNYSSISNYISIIFFLCSTFESETNESLTNAILNDRKLNYYDVKLVYLRNAPDKSKMESNVSIRKDYVADCNATITSYLNELKHNSEYCDIADYLLAVRFFVGFVDNDFEMSINQKIAVELIDMLGKLENKYALQFLSLFS